MKHAGTGRAKTSFFAASTARSGMLPGLGLTVRAPR